MQGFSSECLILSGAFLLGTGQTLSSIALISLGILSSFVRFLIKIRKDDDKEKLESIKKELLSSANDIVKSIMTVANEKTFH